MRYSTRCSTRLPLRSRWRFPLLALMAGSLTAGGVGSLFGQSPVAICGSYGRGVCGSPIHCPAEPVCPGYSGYGPACGAPLVTFFAPRREPIVILPEAVPAIPAAPAFVPLGGNIDPAPQIQWIRPLGAPAMKQAAPSSPEAKLDSLRTQQVGDRWFRQQDYRGAVSRYRDAIEQAPDRGEVHLRLAVALIVMQRYDRAIEQLRLGLRKAPDLLDEPPSLDEMFGKGNVLAKNNVLLRVGEWVKEEPFDAQRPYVLGLLMLLDGDNAAAEKLLARGNALGGQGDVLTAFLGADAGADAEP